MLKTRSILCFALTLILLTGCAAPGAGTPPIAIQDVHELEQRGKSELFTRSRLWIAETFTDAKEVIELADEENGTLMGNGVFNMTFLGMNIPTKFALRIDVKDGRLRTTYRDFKMYGDYSNSWITLTEGSPNGYPGQVRERVAALNESLISFMESSGSDSNW